MKKNMTQKMTYLGVGAGLILFALFGILPGLFISGAAGLSIAGMIFGTPVEPGILARIMIAVSMLAGVMVSGLIFITATSTTGWALGLLIDALRGEKKAMTPVETQ